MERPGWVAVVTACAAACAVVHAALVPALSAAQGLIAVPLVTTVISVPEPVAPRVAFTDDQDTSRILDADVSDAVASDGSARRTIAAANFSDIDGTFPLDERGPAYSPDGVSLVWSREVFGGGRELVRGRADGSDAVPLAYERRSGDVDVDPVWSPDGNRIAFTRYEWNTTLETTVDPATWVVDLAAERKEGAPVPARRLTEVPPAGGRFGEEVPAWSPDGSFLAVSRRYAPDLKIELEVPESASAGQEIGVAATVTNVGRVGTEPTEVILELPEGSAAAALPARCIHLAGAISCPVAPLPAGGSSVQKWTVLGKVHGKYDVVARVLVQGDPNPANNVASTAIAILPGDLQLTLPPGSTVYRGDSVTLSGTVTNLGPGRTGAAEVTFSPSPGLTLTDQSEQCMLKVRDLACPVPSLAPDEKPQEWSLTVHADEWGKQSITGNVVGPTSESRLDNNTAVATVDVPVQIIEGGGPSPGDVTPPPAEIDIRLVSSPVRAPGALALSPLPVPARVAGPPPLEQINSTAEVWVLNSTTGDARPLTAPDPCMGVCTVTGLHPAWSPDGSQIAVSDQGVLRIVTLRDDDAAGGPDVPHAALSVAAVTGSDAPGSPTPSPTEFLSPEDPAWSPDGAEIFFSAQPTGRPYQGDIYAVAPDGSKLRTVVQGRGPETEPALQPWANLAVQLAADPASISVGQASTIRATAVNNGPSPAAAAKILLEMPAGLTALSTTTEGCDVSAASVTCTLTKWLEKGATVSVDVQVRGDAEGEHESTATVSAQTPDPRTTDNQATTSIQSSTLVTVGGSADLSVDLTLDQNEGWTGGQSATGKAKITNIGPGAAADVRLKVSVAGSLALESTDACPEAACSLDALASGASREVDLKFSMPASNPTGGLSAPPVEVTVEASTSTSDPIPGNNVDREEFTVRQPGVFVYPAVAKPGDVVTVVVEGLPPNAAVTLAWSKGIAPDKSNIPVDGTELRRGLLLLRRDQLGTRDIIVTSPQGLFGEIRAPMLVVARPVSPMPDFIGRG